MLIQRYQLCLCYATNYPVQKAIMGEGEPRQHLPLYPSCTAYLARSGAVFVPRQKIWNPYPP